MSTAQQRSTESLFHQWRKGDQEAGQAMAQRFTDWYFAIAASRLGERHGDHAYKEACTTFSRGVGKVGDARRLLGWAHGIARKQIHAAVPGGRLPDGDEPNAFTRKHAPKEVLTSIRGHLPQEMQLLEHAYGGAPIDDPQAILDARYRVKAFLRDQVGVPFRVVPEQIDPDRAPLPFYEAGHMKGESEDTHFELYMLHDMEVCQDVAEFAHFALALRGGLGTPVAAPPPVHAAPPPVQAGSVSPDAPTVDDAGQAPAQVSAAGRPQARVIPSQGAAPQELTDEDAGGPPIAVIAVAVAVAGTFGLGFFAVWWFLG